MEYVPHTLGTLHLGLVGLGLYVSGMGTAHLKPENASENAFREVTVDKTRLTSSAIAITVLALVQLATLFSYHYYGFEDYQFKGAYFVLAIVNIILGSIVLAESIELLQVEGMTLSNSSGGTDGLDNDNHILIGATVFAGLTIVLNMLDLYHAKTARHTVMKRGRK
jgi:hypothetical protein